jgi:tRNA(adenine34) deaminase
MATRKWSAGVKTVSTYPEHNLFNQDAETVAKHLASKKVSPKGPASGMRMLNFYINRAGKNLSQERRDELEKAKGILSGIIRKQKDKAAPKSFAKSAAKKSAKKAVTKSRVTARKPATKSAPKRAA